MYQSTIQSNYHKVIDTAKYILESLHIKHHISGSQQITVYMDDPSDVDYLDYLVMGQQGEFMNMYKISTPERVKVKC